MVRITHRVDIRRPVPDVFGYVADPRNFRHWGTGVLEVEQVAGSPEGVGATYRYVRRVFGRTVTGRMRVDRTEPGRVFALQGDSEGDPWTSLVSFAETPAGTRLTEVISQEVRGGARLAGPLIALMIGRIVRADHATLKRVLERGPARGPVA